MNLRELSELVQVTVHLKNVINSAGYTKFNNNTIITLKKKLAEFDELFISEVLSYENRNDAKVIHDAVQEARQKMGLDQKYASGAQLREEVFRKAHEEAGTTQENNELALAKLQAAAKKVPAGSGKKTIRRNAVPVRSTEETATDKSAEPVEKLASTEEQSEKEEQPKKVATPSSNQPYMEDQSLAALLAAERQKVAAKKRK